MIEEKILLFEYNLIYQEIIAIIESNTRKNVFKYLNTILTNHQIIDLEYI